MKRFCEKAGLLYILVALIFGIGFQLPSTAWAASKLVDLPLANSLIDSRGNLTAGSLIANSDRTNFTGTLPLQKLRGTGVNLIEYGDDISNAWWSIVESPNSTASTIIANNVNTAHNVYKIVNYAAGTYCFSAKVKAGDAEWVYLDLFTGTGHSGMFFNATTGALGLAEGFAISAYTSYSADSDGFFRFVMYATVTTPVTYIQIYPIKTYSGLGIAIDYPFAGDNSTPSIYIKNIQLEQLPSGQTIGPDLMDAESLTARVEGYTLVVDSIYKIVSRATLDFTTVGAADNTAGTYFVCHTAAALGAGDAASTVNSPSKGQFNAVAMLAGSTELVTNGGFETAGAGGADPYGTWTETAGGNDVIGYGTGYGVRWNQSTDAYTIGNVTAGTFAEGSITASVQANMKRCVVEDDGDVAYYLCSTNSALKADCSTPAVLNGTDGQVMVEVPKFYYIQYQSGNYRYFFVNDKPFSFVDGSTHIHAKFSPEMYIGAYEASLWDNSASSYVGGISITEDTAADKLASVSGILPIVNFTLPGGRSMATNRGSGWHQYDANAHAALHILFLTEYGTFKSQAALGNGITGYAAWPNSPQALTGNSNAVGNASGSSYAAVAKWATGTAYSLNTEVIPKTTQNGYTYRCTTAGTSHATDEPVWPTTLGNTVNDNGTVWTCVRTLQYLSYRGIENWYGHIWKFVDGVNVNNDGSSSKLYLATNHSVYASDTATGYSYAGDLAAADGYPIDIINTVGVWPKTVGGSSSTYLADFYFTEFDSTPSVGWRVAMLGNSAIGGANAGASCWYSLVSSAYSLSSMGGRLCYQAAANPSGITGYDSANPYLGSAHAKLTNNDSGDTYVDQTITVTANTLNKLVFYTRGDATVGGRYSIYDLSNSADILATTATGVTAATYAEVTKWFWAPAGCTSVRIRLQAPSAAGAAYFDYVSVRQAQTAWTNLGANVLQIDSTKGSGGALQITYGDNANGAQVLLADAANLTANLTVNKYYRKTLKTAVSAGGSVVVEIRNAADTVLASYTETATTLTSRTLNFKADHATTNKLTFSGMGAGESVFVDDVVMQQIPDESLLIPGPYAATAGSTAVISAQVPYGPYGVVHEGEGINYENYSCDMTQTSAWTASNITPLKDVTDAFGDVNGATRLTATSNNGTILSTVTVDGIANNKIYSVWLKRITGTGTVSLTDDNSNWTAKTITSDWVRYELAARSQATPVIGIKLGTSGDVIAACLNQLEKSAFVTSAIPTRGCPQVRLTTAGSATNGYSWLMSTTVKNAFGAAAPSRFTLIAEITPGVNYGYPGVRTSLVSANNSDANLLYGHNAGNFFTYDGTNATVAVIPWESGTTYTVAIRADSTANGGAGYLQSSEKHGGVWTHGTAVAYDGAFTLGTYLRLAFTNEYPFAMKNLQIIDKFINTRDLEKGNYQEARMPPMMH